MPPEFHHESPETAARNEVLVMEALAQLGTANATQIAKATGLSIIATRMALRRQNEICLYRQGQKWSLLDQPNDGVPSSHRITGIRIEKLSMWLESRNINYSEIWKTKGKFYWIVKTPAKDLSEGDTITIRRRIRRTIRRVVKTEIRDGNVLVYFRQGVSYATKSFPPDSLIERHHAIKTTEIDRIEIREVS